MKTVTYYVKVILWESTKKVLNNSRKLLNRSENPPKITNKQLKVDDSDCSKEVIILDWYYIIVKHILR